MQSKFTYKRQILAYFAGVFTVFTVIIVAFQLRTDRKYKEEILQSRLSGYADMLSRASDYGYMASMMPADLRATVIGKDGQVLFDTQTGTDTLDNHFMRPEVQSAIEKGEGFAVRTSSTTSLPYFYYAKSYDGLVVRVALPYKIDVKRFLYPDTLFLVLVFSLFVAVMLFLVFFSDYFGDGITKLLRKSDSMVELEKEKNRVMKQQMTNNIAHELRTPVSSIRGYLETLVSCPDIPEERRKIFIDRAYVQTLRLSDLIRDIALITKIESAPEQLQKETVVLRDVFDGIVEEFRTSLDERNIEAVNGIEDSAVVNGNPTLIYAIFRNLVENSVKYAGESIMINAECRAGDDGFCHCTYYDTGSGVGEEHLSRIFERFYRVSEGRTRDAGGSGLGLSIVRNAVAFHGGEIVACNRPGGGLEFKFTLKI